MTTPYQDFPAALLTLAPRLTRTGDPSASVQGINTTLLGDGCWCYCVENKAEYQLDRADNSTPADGDVVIAPTAGPGRWFKRLPTTGGASGLVQMGWDQVDILTTLTASALPADNFTNVVIRNGGILPLQVQLSNVTPGNRLRIDYSGVVFQLGDITDGFANFIAVVSFNGNGAYAPGNGFFWVNNSAAVAPVPLVPSRPTFRGLAAVAIPPGATTATVQVAYAASIAGLSIAGLTNFVSDPRNAGMTLEVSEVLAAVATQPGPSTAIIAY
jgi:hypothetical protein